MNRLRRVFSGLSAGAVALLGLGADAFACDGNNPQQYASSKTVWCIDPTVWSQHQNELTAFFPYGDAVVDELTMLFGVSPSNLPFTIEAAVPDGSAQTPSDYGPGVKVTGDAFYGSAGGVNGFWGYLLVLHEFVNQWTGLVSGGWPNDWWADHRSPFPNSMDWHVMADLGGKLGSTDLKMASQYQKSRFDPGGSDYDPEVGMFDAIFALPNYGFAGLGRVFSYVRQDGMNWDGLRDPPAYQDHNPFVSGNPSELLADHIIAYLSLGSGTDLTGPISAAGVGPKPPQWPAGLDYQDYQPSSGAVGAIADAHCALAAVKSQIDADSKAGKDTTAAKNAYDAAMSQLRKGDYGHTQVNGVQAACGSICPSECGCDEPKNVCVAPWHAVKSPAMGAGGGGMSAAGGMTGTGGAPASGGQGGDGGSPSSAGGASGKGGGKATGVGGSGIGGTPGTGGTPGAGGNTAGHGGMTAAGGGKGGAAAGGKASSTGGAGGHPGLSFGGAAPVGSSDASDGDTGSSGGCGVSRGQGTGALAGAVVSVLLLVRRRRSRR